MPDRVSDVENILAALRPTTQVDPDWADAELRRIMATPAAPHRRRWWLVCGAATAVTVLGGAAYAGGLIPSSVTEVLGSGNQAQPIFRVGDVRQVFELTTRDGAEVRYFSAPNNAGGQCWTVTRDLQSDTDPEDLSYTCDGSYSARMLRQDQDGVAMLPTDADNPGPPILFGLNLGGFELPHGTRRVRVTGPGLDKTMPARAPEGWAVELPANAQGSTYVVEFLGHEGAVLARIPEPIDNRHRW